VIIHVNWRDLEAAGDQQWSEPAWQGITDQIANNPQTKFALRVFAGESAPDWLRNGTAGPCVDVTYTRPQASDTYCEPRFWLPDYQAEWSELISEIVRRYGDEPRLLDVIASACSLHFAETGILGGDDPSGLRLYEAGLNQDNYRACMLNTTGEQVTKLAAVGIRTSIGVHTNWQIATSLGVQSAGWPAWRDQVLQPLATAHGDRLIFQNNGLGPADVCAPGEPLDQASGLYCWMASRHPVGFQFGGIGSTEEMRQATENGITMRGCFIERAIGNLQSLLSADEIAAYDQRLEAGCAAAG